MSLLGELNRRRVFRALVAYGIASFAVLQIIELVMHGLHWPEAVLSYVVVALALGFPLVVALAWVFDVKAGRFERTAPAQGLGRARLAAVIIGIGLLAAAPGVAWYFFLRPGARSPQSDEAMRATLDAVPPASDIRAVPSIAVLPLVNLSRDPDQEYFADGLAEELLNLLAKVTGLRVAGRTSSFSFKGKSEDLRTIGQKLNVKTVLEGSVQRAGERLRINPAGAAPLRPRFAWVVPACACGLPQGGRAGSEVRSCVGRCRQIVVHGRRSVRLAPRLARE